MAAEQQKEIRGIKYRQILAAPAKKNPSDRYCRLLESEQPLNITIIILLYLY